MRGRNAGLTSALASIVVLALITATQALIPTAPILASPNTQSSPSNLVFSFSLSNNLPTSAYLMIVFPFYVVTITPKSCTLLNQMVTTAVTCQNLNLASAASPNPLTINATRVNDINPNVQSSLTIVTSFSDVLVKGTSYSIQIILQDNLPAIGALSESFEMYAMSGTGVMLEENWNMGQVFLEMRNNNLLNLVSITSQTTASPGLTFSTVVDVTVGVASPTALSTFVFTVSGNFIFTVSSQVTTIAVTGDPPQIKQTTIVSPNIIRIIFNEQFAVGRQFRLSISNIYNPMEISQGALSLYNLPYNSITPLEVSELSIPYQTNSFVPTLALYTAEGLSPSAPMEFYMSTVQYITLTIQLPRALEPTFILQVKSDALSFQTGTAYLKTDTINSNTLSYSFPNSQTIQVKGFPYLIPSGTIITFTFSAWIATNPIFNIYVSIDTQAHVDSAYPIIYGTISATVSAIPELFVSLLTGNLGEPNALTAMTTTTSSISFSVTPLFSTYSGSFLKIYTSKHLTAHSSFSGSTSCLVNAVPQPCTITTGTYTVITIASSSSSNLYPISTTTAITINQLTFEHSSSHSTYLYHFYFQLTVSLASGTPIKKYLAVPMVVPERSKLSNFNVYFSNNIYNPGSNFLNVIRLVSSNPAQWQNVIQVNQKRIISIFAYQGWKNLFTTISNNQPYPCNSNLANTYTYITGSNSQNLTAQYPLNWDRINIVLPGTESSTSFSIIIPTLYLATSDHLFEIMVGYIDINTGQITYLQAGARPTTGATTLLTPANIAVYSKPKQTAMQLNIAGLAGSYYSNVNFTVVPSATYQGTTYSACLMVLSSWQFYDSLTALSATSLAAADPDFANIEQTPLSIKISDSSYLTHIPFKTGGVYGSTFNIILDNLKLPYSLDLPYYSVSLIDKDGAMDGYNQFINQDQNIFYTGVLQSLALTCNDNSMGVTNTDCTLTFSTFQEIEAKSVLILTLHGLFVSTNLCSMRYSSTNATIPVTSCAPNTDMNVLTVSLGNAARLPASTTYALTVNGMSIDSGERSNYVKLQVMDPTGSYSIEEKTVILITSVVQNFPIEITQVNFKYNNPVIFSELSLNFTLPRALNQDEAFALVLNKDFITLNKVPSKIRIRLMQSGGLTEIVTSWVMKPINSQIIFQNLYGVLVGGSYSLQLYGIQTPSTVTQDMVTIIYLRIYDNTYAKTNIDSSTASFPTLTTKVDSLITLQTYFNTEGSEQELMFTVVNQFKPVTQNTIWLVNLPVYYSPSIWNDQSQAYCTISGTPLSCQVSTYTPSQIVISNSPLLLSASSNTTYTINIYGIVCPRASYLNGNTMFATESIFFAVAESSLSTSLADYSSLFVSNPVINPMTQPSYGNLVITAATSSNLQVYQTTFFTLTVVCSVAIPTGSWIFVTFPQQFDNFNDIPVVVQTQSSVTNYEVSTSSSVVNTRIGYQLNIISLAANTEFQIMITSLMTPTTPGTVDINKIKVVVATSDRLSTVAVSINSRNRAATMTFQPNSLHLVVNNYQNIQLTAGTYSNPIRINPSDNSTFLTNMMVSFTSSTFTFLTNPTYLYLGNSYSNVIIGAGQNTIPTTYSFNLVKKETSVSAFYATLSDYAVIVTSLPIPISFPSSFTVPKGGCSMPVAVELTNAPYSYITIYYEYNTTAVLPQWFWVNQEISQEQMEFNINNTKRWVSFCSSSAIAVTSFDINLNLGGDNSASYSFSTATTHITIDSSATAVAPAFSLFASNVQKTFATVQVNTNTAGFFYYHLSIAPLYSPLTLNEIHTYIKSNVQVLESNQDYLTTKIYKVDRDQRVGYQGVAAAGATYVQVENLLPERSYVMCGYFQNTFGQSTAIQCCNFTMQAWGVISKAEITFNTTILANQLNNLLCFFVKASDSEITQIVDLEGHSCSLNTSPNNYYYAFQGNTTTWESTKTTIYHTAHPNLTSDASITSFKNIFDANGITTASLSLAQTQFSINFIQKSTFSSNFEPMQAISATAAYQPSITFTLRDYVKSSFKVQIAQLRSSQPATVYFILVSHKNITTNQITSTTTISIKPIITPTHDQVASCVDGSSAAAVQCMRVVMLANIDYSFYFQNLVENSVYALHYAYANEYPQRPIFYGAVQTSYIYTTTHEHWTQLVLVGLLLLMAIAM